MVATTANAAEACKVAKINTLPVVMDGFQPLVRAEVNDTPVYFLLDTGAFATTLFVDQASKLALPSVDMVSINTARLVGVDGVTGMRGANIAKFTLGDQTIQEWHVAVGAADMGGAGKDGIPVVGLLGEDVLGPYDLDIDLAHGALTLYRAQGCEKTYLAQWSKDALLAEVEPATAGNAYINIHVAVNGQRVHAIVDSGASHSLLSLKAAARAGITPDSPGVTEADKAVGVAGRSFQEWLAVFDSVAVGDETVQHAKLRVGRMYTPTEHLNTGTRLSDHPDNRIEMLLGADFLRAHHVLVARSQNLMYFTHQGGAIFQTTGPALNRPQTGEPPAQ
ncbi:MAG: retroviral-like aspartic protease family protein [Azospirillaceae bacterium]|nr:retroviral-like aspartic protease family protein [Azospirillaceae bacterium]